MLSIIYFSRVRLCREKKSGDIYAMKKLKKSEMLSRGQVHKLDVKKKWRGNRGLAKVVVNMKPVFIIFVTPRGDHLPDDGSYKEPHVICYHFQFPKRICEASVEHVKAERNLLAEVASHCIVKLYYSFQDAEDLYLIMEYLPGGDIMTLLIREETLTETVARFYISQSVLAIESIHKHNYIHRDIKPDNLLLDKNGHMKLSDFGLCKPLDCTNLSAINENEALDDENLKESMDADGCFPEAGGRRWKSPLEQLQHWQINRRKLAFSTVGTPDYIAPEVLLKKGYGVECDCMMLPLSPQPLSHH
ncbi:hypothetical protein OIU84_010684 [Salix udensis]|uniref:non-specific serine/threonine protein kinase n=1 Tax=Salix udensis TaxID=889485 RepID=A0AAD6JL98_9ROSI|nr:hypothetical protein OIU84_010684 [Salix udensis]